MNLQFTVVSNTSPIFYATQIGQFELLRALYSQIIIPQAVYDELVVRPKGLAVSDQIRTANWVERRQVQNRDFVANLRLELDEGESESIALAKEISANLLLVDEMKGRTIATREGLAVIGILGVLLEAKYKKIIPRVKPLLDKLWKTNFRANRQLYERVLKQAQE